MKQGSEGTVKVNESSYVNILAETRQLYNRLIAMGVAPEQARMVLPQSTYTEWYWSGSLYAFSRICKLRLDKNSQVEVQEIARQLSANCSTKFPHSWNALMQEGE